LLAQDSTLQFDSPQKLAMDATFASSAEQPAHHQAAGGSAEQPIIFNLANACRELTRISADKANKVIIKKHRGSSELTQGNFIDITHEIEWRRWVAFHDKAAAISANGGGIVAAYVAEIWDEMDHNHDCCTIDLILLSADGTYVRIHPNKNNPSFARAGSFDSWMHHRGRFGGWQEHPFQDTPRPHPAASARAAQPAHHTAATSSVIPAGPRIALPHPGAPASAEQPCSHQDIMPPPLPAVPVLACIPPPPSSPPPASADWQIFHDARTDTLWWQCGSTGKVQKKTPPDGWSVYRDDSSGHHWCAKDSATDGMFYWMPRREPPT
jgi:hypothetical protein